MSRLFADELAPGTLVGTFVVERACSRGVMSVLHLARDERGRPAALKVLRSEYALSPGARRRYRQEVAMLQGLKHPHIVELLGAGELRDGRPWLAMEWLDGRDLAAELAAHGYRAAPEALAIAEQVASALAAAHRAGIVHRDLKAQNVMVQPGPEGPRVKLVDFGIAKPLAQEQGSGLTTTGRILGTPIALAPEQILGGPIDARTDVYALGVLLYQLLTGRLPFEAPTAQELEEMHVHAPAPRVGALAPVPPGVDAVVRRCLAKRPQDRYPGPEEVIAELRCALGESTATAPARAAALYLQVAVPEDASDAALERQDALIEQARRFAGDERLSVALEGADFLLVIAGLPAGEAEEREERERLIALAERLGHALEASRGGAPLRVALTLHAGAGGAGGELLSPGRWAQGPDGEGLAVTAAASEGIATS